MKTCIEIAQRIKRPNEDVRRAGDRVRNWSKERVLICSNEHPGTGNSRLYSDDEAERAVIVEMMARLGLQVVGDRHRVLATKIMNDPLLKADLVNLLAALEDEDDMRAGRRAA